MAKLKEELLKTLQDLREEEFRHFRWFLDQDDILEGFSGIPKSRLEKAERIDTVDLMVHNYPMSPGALDLTLKILEKISRNDLVQRLSRLKDIKNNHSAPLQSHHHETRKAKLAEMNRMIQEREMKIKEIKHSVELSNKSADRHIADSERVFNGLLQSIRKSLTNLIDAIHEKQKTVQTQADGFIKALEQEISELKKTSYKMEQLSHTENNLSSQSANPTTTNWTEVKILPPSYGGSVGAAVNQLEKEFKAEKEKLIAKAKLYRVQEFAKDVTLDPETANPFLVLSHDGKQVYCRDVKQNLPDNPKRFTTAGNVLGEQSFSSGRFYFEVQVKGKTSWDLGVVKETIDRKGQIAAKPENGYWTMCLRGDEYKASAGDLSVKHRPKKVGVFVDYEKGSVSFHDVDSADLLHSFSDCSFTEKLYPFFSPGRHHGDKNSSPLIISPVNNTNSTT